MATHSVLLPGKSPWTEEPGRLQSMGSLSDFTFTFHFHPLEKEMATHSSVLAWRIPGTGGPGGWPSMGSQSWTRLKRLSSSSSSSRCNLWLIRRVYVIIKLFNSQVLCEKKVKVLVTQSCLTLCDPMDCSPPDSPVHEFPRPRILKWVAISFSRGLPDPGIEPRSPALKAGYLPSEPPRSHVQLPLFQQRKEWYILQVRLVLFK